MENFKILKTLGTGSFSEVFKVLRISDNKEYAMKKVRFSSLSKKEKQSALNEIRILASVKHKNVVVYKEAFFDEAKG
jgi:NIMA (never in mitosis gene a)-related kinase 1/4/5